MRLVRLAGAGVMAGLLAGCSVGWPISHSEIGAAKPDAARVVVYRPPGVKLSWRLFSVDVNDGPGCDLAGGSGFAMDTGAGKVTVAVHLWSIPGKSSLSWTAESGKTYFVRVQVAGETAPGAVGGLLGLGAGEEPSADAGAFELALTDEAAAIASGVKLAQCPR